MQTVKSDFSLDRRVLWEILEFFEKDIEALHKTARRRGNHPLAEIFLSVQFKNDWYQVATKLKSKTRNWQEVLSWLMDEDTARSRSENMKR